MGEKILDLDSSKIISTGTIERSGYLPRITQEILEEIIHHGINPSTGTYLLDQKTPSYSDFTSVHRDNVVSCYFFNTGTRAFFIEKFTVGKSSCASLCGNENHPAVVVIMDTGSGKKYGVCAQVSTHGGDFSLAKQYIFFPENHKQFEPPRDRCLGRTLKKIINI